MQYEESEPEKIEKKLNIPPVSDKVAFAYAVLDSMNIMGWTLPWTIDQNDSSVFKFKADHFGAEYRVNVFLDKGTVEINRIEKGFWPTFNSLHFGGEEVPNAPSVINSWSIYQNITVITILFSIISGIYLWINKKSERTIGVILLSGITGMSFLFMIYIWLVG